MLNACSGVTDKLAKMLRNATCAWSRNSSVTATGGCPADMAQMCGLDYSNWAALKAGYRASVTEVRGLVKEGRKGRGTPRGEVGRGSGVV